MQTIRQYTEVVDGSIHLTLPSNFKAKRVELIISSADKQELEVSNFEQFLLDSPEMSDEELQAIEAKRGHLNSWV